MIDRLLACIVLASRAVACLMLRSAINVRVRKGSFPLGLVNRDGGMQRLYQP